MYKLSLTVSRVVSSVVTLLSVSGKTWNSGRPRIDCCYTIHEERCLGRGKPAQKLTCNKGIFVLGVVTTEPSKLWHVG